MLLQYLVVGVVVLCAAAQATRKYLPRAWREWLVYRLSGRGGRGRLVKWLGTDAGCGGGCASCGSCAPAPAPGAETQGRKVIPLRLER